MTLVPRIEVLALGCLVLAACQLPLTSRGTTGSSGLAPASSSPPAARSDAARGAVPGRMAGVAYEDGSRDTVAAAEAFAGACFADYDDMRTRWAPYEATLRARFRALRTMPNYYAQRDEARLLAKQLWSDAATAKLNVGITYEFLIRGGLAREVDLYMAEQHRTRGIPARVEVFESQYPLFDDDALAGDVYCHGATQSGTHRTRSESWLNFRALLPEPRASRLQAYLRAQAATNKRDFATPPRPKRYENISMTNQIKSREPFEVGAVLSTGGIVKTVRPLRGAVAIRAAVPLKATAQHDCVQTKQVDRVRSDGRVEYRENCKVSGTTTEIIFELSFLDVPDVLKPGDWIDFDARIRGSSMGPVQARTRAPKTVTLELDGLLVRNVSRAKKPGDRPSAFEVLASY